MLTPWKKSYNQPRQHLWRRQWQPTPVLLPGKSNGQRSLEGCSPCGRSESDTTERLHFHFSLSCIGEGNGNPLQCSCLENPRDRGAWWAAVYGVAQSQTWLKQLSSSSRQHIKKHRHYWSNLAAAVGSGWWSFFLDGDLQSQDLKICRFKKKKSSQGSSSFNLLGRR